MENKKIECKYCNDTGYFIHTRVIDGIPYEYACKCVCKSAEGKDYDGTKIEDVQHRQPFYLATVQEVFGDRLNNEQK